MNSENSRREIEITLSVGLLKDLIASSGLFHSLGIIKNGEELVSVEGKWTDTHIPLKLFLEKEVNTNS